VVARGEKPIELRDSWFFAKSIEVERYSIKRGVEHCMGKGGPKPYRLQGNSEYPFYASQILHLQWKPKLICAVSDYIFNVGAGNPYSMKEFHERSQSGKSWNSPLFFFRKRGNPHIHIYNTFLQNSRQTLSAKVQSQEGKSPDRLLRSPRES
jgi:hypothetical protein